MGGRHGHGAAEGPGTARGGPVGQACVEGAVPPPGSGGGARVGWAPVRSQATPTRTHHQRHHRRSVRPHTQPQPCPHRPFLCAAPIRTQDFCQTRSEVARGEPVLRRPPGVVKKHALCWVCHAHSQFENRSRSRGSPESCLSCVALPDVTTTKVAFRFDRDSTFALEPSYPEGNFEGNQLLGGSIGLSPLCRTQATRFARQNSDQLPPQFPMASL